MTVSALLSNFVKELPDVHLEVVILALVVATVIAILIRVASKLMNSSMPFSVSLKALCTCYLVRTPQ
jgi:type III secretory pathway component EscS